MTSPECSDRPASPGIDLLYGLEDRPPLPRLFLYGMQWVFVALPNLTVFSVLMAGLLQLSPEAASGMLQRMMVLVGATAVAQTFWGHRLPLLDGPALALLVAFAALAKTGPESISGGMIFGGLLLFLFGLFKIMRFVSGLFTDRVIGVILMLISLVILPILTPMLMGRTPVHPNGQPVVMLLSAGLIIVMALMFHFLKGLLQSLSIFWGVLIGTAAFALLGLADFSTVGNTRWLGLPAWPARIMPAFDPAAALSVALAYVAVLVNATGSLFGVQPLVGADGMEKRLNRSLVLTGLSGMASGPMGLLGTVPYSLSPGVITVTRVGSRYTMTACGLILVALAFLNKITALFTSVPDAVVGAALLVSMAAQLGVAIDIFHRQTGRLSRRDYLIIGLPVLMGVLASLLPDPFIRQLPAYLRPILGNGLIVGVIFVLLLEHVVMKENRAQA